MINKALEFFPLRVCWRYLSSVIWKSDSETSLCPLSSVWSNISDFLSLSLVFSLSLYLQSSLQSPCRQTLWYILGKQCDRLYRGMVVKKCFLNAFVSFIGISWLPVYHSIHDTWYRLIGVTNLVEFFIQISLIGVYSVSTGSNCWKGALFSLDCFKGTPVYVLVSICLFSVHFLFQVVTHYKLVQHQKSLIFLNVLIHMQIVQVNGNWLIGTIHNLQICD